MSDVAAWAQWLAEAVARRVQEQFCRPTATYRLQFEPGRMGFRDAAAIAPYLDDLGVSHLYASPYLKTRSGSQHGYAIVDYSQLNPALGAAEDYQAMVEALRGRGLGQILDTVPNHMSAAPTENRWWNDVLENGPSSPHAAFFDIDWRPIKEELRNKLLLPILGDQYGQVLESGELKLEYRDGAFGLRYYESLLPLDPRTYRTILTHRFDSLKDSESVDAEALRELESIITALEHLPARTEIESVRVAERQREKEVIKSRLRKLTESSSAIAAFVERNVAELNGSVDDPHSFDPLDKLLDAQVYRLSHWKAAADEINYRRFFDINDLAAVCMEDPEVFAESHRLLFELLLRGDVDGLRIDHIDGLYDPAEYLWRLQSGYLLAIGKDLYRRATESPNEVAAVDGETPPAIDAEGPASWQELEPAFLPRVTALTCADRSQLPLYVVAEKILGADESLPEQWMLAGTTGYEFLNSVAGLFVEPTGLAELVKQYGRFVDQRLVFRDIIHQSKLLIVRTAMLSDLQLLAHRVNRISERHRRSRDFTLNTLRVALREILACFPVYRKYIRRNSISERDRLVLSRATAQAKRRNPTIDGAAFDFIRDSLLLEMPPDVDESSLREREMFVGRFQQVSSPVMAKGIEDTAFYRYFPLASLNEVGGDPGRQPNDVEEFHRQNLARQSHWPRSLIATSTHDTKRSEDARARMGVLSEIPHVWRKAVNRWARLNRRHHREVDGQPAPCRNDEYLFYQSLVGVWPLESPGEAELAELAARMSAYMEKATHEAKVHTSWINPDSEYDSAMRAFVAAVLDDRSKPRNRFLADFRQFQEQVVDVGLYNAMAQTLLKLTSPGVPDIYQGQEMWDFSLVDPDNRRPVDYGRRRALLDAVAHDVSHGDAALFGLAEYLARHPRDPRTKMFLTWRTLQFRHCHAELFRQGDYIPLEVQGAKAEHVCAFARRQGPLEGADQEVAIIVVPRWIAKLTMAADSTLTPPLAASVWADTQLIVRPWTAGVLTNLFTGERLAVADAPLMLGDVLANFPVAVLSSCVAAE